jgi:hypothetical protein
MIIFRKLAPLALDYGITKGRLASEYQIKIHKMMSSTEGVQKSEIGTPIQRNKITDAMPCH